jgi:hypothetical protein
MTWHPITVAGPAAAFPCSAQQDRVAVEQMGIASFGSTSRRFCALQSRPCRWIALGRSLQSLVRCLLRPMKIGHLCLYVHFIAAVVLHSTPYRDDGRHLAAPQ